MKFPQLAEVQTIIVSAPQGTTVSGTFSLGLTFGLSTSKVFVLNEQGIDSMPTNTANLVWDQYGPPPSEGFETVPNTNVTRISVGRRLEEASVGSTKVSFTQDIEAGFDRYMWAVTFVGMQQTLDMGDLEPMTATSNLVDADGNPIAISIEETQRGRSSTYMRVDVGNMDASSYTNGRYTSHFEARLPPNYLSAILLRI